MSIMLVGAPSFYRAARSSRVHEDRIVLASRSGKLLMGDQDHEPAHGIFYLKSSIESQYCASVACVDLNLEHYKRSRRNSEFDQFLFLDSLIAEREPTAIGVASMRPNYSEALKIAEWIRENHPGRILFLGGACASDPMLPKSDVFDFLVASQLEEAVLQSLARNLSLVPLGHGSRHIPFPDYSDLSDFSDLIPRYFQSIGCGAGCEFCYPAAIRNFKLTTVSGVPLYDRIEKDLLKFSPKFWLLGDLTFYLKSKQSTDLLNSLLDRDIPPWWCQTQARYLSEKSCGLLRRAGCSQVAFAVEDFSSEDRWIRAKNSGLEQTIDCLEALGKVGIDRQVYWCFGLPDDSHAASMNRIRDIEYLVSLGLIDSIHLSYLMPYPGTPYGDQPNRFGLTVHRTFDEHFAEVDTDFYDPLPLHSTRELSSKDIKDYFDGAREVGARLKK